MVPGALLVAGLAVVVAWVVRGLAPPSLIRDGRRLPVAMAGQHAASGHHASELVPPSPVSGEPLANFLGAAFLAVHVLAVGLWLITRLLNRWGVGKTVARLGFATLVALAAGLTAVLAARVSYRDGLAFGEALAGGAEVARYAFAAGLVFGVLWIRERAVHEA